MISYLISLFFIKPKDRIEIFLKTGNEFEGVKNVPGIALFGVSKIKKDFSPRTFHPWTDFSERGRPNITHGSEHSPINKPHEVSVCQESSKFLESKPGADVFPGHLLKGLMFAEHNLS